MCVCVFGKGQRGIIFSTRCISDLIVNNDDISDNQLWNGNIGEIVNRQGN